MNKKLVSREIILSVAKEIVIQSGIQMINMREVAGKCGVSVGSVYNYFPSKGDLVIATIESVWSEIMHDFKVCVPKLNFAENVLTLFKSVETGCQKYPSFFSIHAMSVASSDKSKGRNAMNNYFSYIKNVLLEALENDTKVRADAFTQKFTKQDFIDFIFENIISLLIKEKKSCYFLLEVIKRIIY